MFTDNAGPVSLVLTTTTPLQLPQQKILALAKKISKLSRSRIQNDSWLSLHLVHVKPTEQENPNAYVNLARIFADTEQVALFPRVLFGTDAHAIHYLFEKYAHLEQEFKPAVVTTLTNTSFPFAPFSPVLLHRNDSMWCDERFALWSSGSFDWEECLWQLWIVKHGAVKALPFAALTWPEEIPISETVIRVSVSSR